MLDLYRKKDFTPFPDGFLPHFRNSARSNSPDIKQGVLGSVQNRGLGRVKVTVKPFFDLVSKRHFFNIPIFGLISIWISLVLRLFRH